MTPIWVAFIKGPNGAIWESTARIGTGKDGEYKARKQSQDAFCHELTARFLKSIPFGLWDSARESGFECVVLEIEQE